MSDSPGAEDRKPFRLLGAIGVLLGLLSTTRKLVELYQTRHIGGTHAYFAYLAYDFLLAIAAGLSGMGLLRETRWATAAATITAAALAVRSATMLIDHGSTYLRLLLELGGTQDPNVAFVIASRVLLYGIEVIYGPILAGLLYIDLQCRDLLDPSIPLEKRRFWWRLGAAALASFLGDFLLRLIPDHPQ